MKKPKKFFLISFYDFFKFGLFSLQKLIDKVLNQESNQLPRFPVNQTLRKFYKKSANNETIGQKDGKLYMKSPYFVIKYKIPQYFRSEIKF